MVAVRTGSSRDHPRIRGEHTSYDSAVRFLRGSSPHTRGAPTIGGSLYCLAGIIPAYAGSTPPRPGRARWDWDHPRIRGEHGRGGGKNGFLSGSSPHTRGALRDGDQARERAGIIPAYAGSTRPLHRRWPVTRDHPRIRGEHTSYDSAVRFLRGSSPHTRGAPR